MSSVWRSRPDARLPGIDAMKSVADISDAKDAANPFASGSGAQAGQAWVVTGPQKAGYDNVFETLQRTGDKATGGACRQTMLNSGLAQGDLSKIWQLGYRWRRMSRSGRVCSVHVPYGGDCAGEAASRCSSTGLHSAFQKVGDCEGPRSKCAYEGAHSIYFKRTKKKNVTFQSRGGILFSFKRMLLSSFLIQTRRRKAGAKQAVSSKFRHR